MPKYPTMYHPTVIVSKIDGISNNALNVINYEENGRKTWAIKNFHGKSSPFFDNTFQPFIYNDRTCICVGESEGKRQLYVFESTPNSNGQLYWKIETEGKLKSIELLNDDAFKIKTDKGEYLLDRFELNKKSDLFDSIMISENNRYLFEKRIDYLDVDHTYFGEVTKEGKIKPFLYDVEKNCYVDTPLVSDPYKRFDQLDIETLKLRIAREDTDRRKQLRKRLDTLKKLNGDYTRR